VNFQIWKLAVRPMTAQNHIVFCGRTSGAEMQNYNIPGKK